MSGRKYFLPWALYDFGNSAFAAVIQTFLFAAYFTESVAEDRVMGGAQWGWMNAMAGLMIAFLAPVIGSIADRSGYRKRWLGFFTFLCVAATASLWWVRPEPGYAAFALYLVGIGTVGSECAFVFYNAMLPDLAPQDSIGRWSGWGWALGYLGGMLCMGLSYALIPLFTVKAAFLFTAFWYAAFSLPLFWSLPDTKGERWESAIRNGIGQLSQTLLHLREYREIVRFLIARIFYIDGLITLFAFGGVYAVAEFGMSFREVLLFGIAAHLFAGFGAAVFSWMDDWYSSKGVILVSIAAVIACCLVIWLFWAKTVFWIFGLLLSVYVGPVQASSRSLMARMTPKRLKNEMFGFFALSGKATAFAGPLLVGWVSYWSESLRSGMLVILLFLLVGAFLLSKVNVKVPDLS